MQVSVMNMAGDVVNDVELPTSIFAAKVNNGLMHQALVRQLANARVGTHKTKGRSEIARTTAKMYRQKGTGNARHGSRRAPIFVGGGIAHGTTPRDYSKKMPRKMRRAALRSALTVKASNGDIVVLDKLEMAAPKTKEIASMVSRLVGDSTALVVVPGRDENVEKSARNLTAVKAVQALYINVRDLLGHEKLVLSLDSLSVISELLATDTVYVAEDEEVEVEEVEEVEASVVEEEAVAASEEAEPEAEIVEEAEPETEVVEDVAPETEVVEDAEPEADDLKKIEGIGPKISSVLAESGVTTFARLAELSIDEIKGILEGKVRIAIVDTWAEQAALAAAGKWDELETLQDELQGGRRA